MKHQSPPDSPGNSSINLLDLVGNPQRVAAAIAAEREAKTQLGWLGVTVLDRANWQMALRLGDGVRQIEVHPKSPARRDPGLQTGDFIKPIRVPGADVPLDELDALALPCGTPILFEFCRPGSTGRISKWIPGSVALTAAPRIPKTPEWKKLPPIPCGRRVQKGERAKFINQMLTRPDITDPMFRCLSLATFKYDNHDNEGFWPSYTTWSRDLQCDRSTAIVLVAKLNWLGLIKIASRPMRHRSTNLYQVTWPGRSSAASPNAKRQTISA
jgi:hypothetical protein